MTWTYDPNRARLEEGRDRVRLLIGDTLETRPLLQNEEIDVALLLAQGVLDAACALACDMIVAKFSGDPDFSHGRVSQQRSQIVDHYRDLGNRFRSHLPGVSQGALQVEHPSDAYFRRGITDHPNIIDLSSRKDET